VREFFLQLRIQIPPPPTRPPLHQGSDNQQFVGQLVSLILYVQERYKDFLFVLSSHNSVQLRRSLTHCMKNITETILDNVWCYKVSHRGKHIPHDVNHNDLSKRTYQQLSIIYLRTIRLSHGPKSKVSFSVPKTAMTYTPPTIPGSNSTKIQPFLQKARRERIMALKKN